MRHNKVPAEQGETKLKTLNLLKFPVNSEKRKKVTSAQNTKLFLLFLVNQLHSFLHSYSRNYNLTLNKEVPKHFQGKIRALNFSLIFPQLSENVNQKCFQFPD